MDIHGKKIDAASAYKCYSRNSTLKVHQVRHHREGQEPGPRLNIKTVLSTYGDFHVKDKTAVRTSYL